MELPFDLDAEVVHLIKNKLIELPTYPGVALKLQKVLSGGNYGLNDLSRLVEADQGLATHVLRCANSAFYRAASPATTLSAGISRIGAKELSNIAIAGTLGVTASQSGPLASLRKDAWRAALLSALVCQELARFHCVDPGEAFLAGLLHDFGETLAYATFEAILESKTGVKPQPLGAWQWEGQRYHVELGMALAADWKLPDFIVESVMRHTDEDLTACAHPKMVKLVGLAERVTLRLLEAVSVEAATLSDLPLTVDELAKLESVVPRVPSWLQSFEDSGSSAVPIISSPSLVAAPPPPSAPRDAVELVITLFKKTGKNERWTGMERTATTLIMKGASALPERHLVNLLVGELSLCATVVSCTASDAGCLVEVKPFAMDKATAARWEKLGLEKRAA